MEPWIFDVEGERVNEQDCDGYTAQRQGEGESTLVVLVTPDGRYFEGTKHRQPHQELEVRRGPGRWITKSQADEMKRQWEP